MSEKNTVETIQKRIRKRGHCWEWTGSITPKGYGRLKFGPRLVLAHRLFYELKNGKVPTGLQLDHLCRNRCCVNPKHLEAVTSKVNTLRGSVPKEFCSKGHRKGKSNRCRVCDEKYQKVYRKQNRAKFRKYLRAWRKKKRLERERPSR